MDGNTTGAYLDFTYFSANATNQSGTIPFTVHSIVVPTVWAVLILVGIVGNGLVIFTLLKQGDRTATTYYIINLAIADFAFIAVVVPFTCTLYALPDWVFGEHMCKFINYMVYVSIFTALLRRGMGRGKGSRGKGSAEGGAGVINETVETWSHI